MLIDCTSCVARDVACGDCVITVLLATPPPASRSGPNSRANLPEPDPLDLDDADRVAIGHLARAGLVPPLRLVAPVSPGAGGRGSAEFGQDSQVSDNTREIA